MTRLTLGLLLAFAPAPALATGLGEPCEATADCDRGLSCEVVGGTSCACPAPSPDQFALPPDCDCPAVEDIKACVPGPCTADTDCSEGLVCATFEETCDTAAAPCPAGEDCGQPEPSCTSTTVSVCAPRWALPCDAASDCGAGFTCESVEECSCTGGAPTDPREPGSGSGSDDFEGSPGAPLPEESCECRPSTMNYCRPIEVRCAADDDCVEGWRCALTSVDVPCAIPEDGGAPRCAPEPAQTDGYCQPIAWTGWGGTSNGDFEENTTPRTPTDDTTTPTTEAGDTDAVASGGGCAGSLPLGLSLTLLPMLLIRRRR